MARKGHPLFGRRPGLEILNVQLQIANLTMSSANDAGARPFVAIASFRVTDSWRRLPTSTATSRAFSILSRL